MRTFLIKFISTFCYIGCLPVAPGTYGSLAGLLIYLLTINTAIGRGFVFLVIGAAGFLTAGRAEKAFGRKDPSCIVIDEVCGMLVSLLFLPQGITVMLLAFLLFRLMDILKPYPLNRLQHLEGGAGIMLDDIAAGLYANAVLQIGLRFAVLRIS